MRNRALQIGLLLILLILLFNSVFLIVDHHGYLRFLEVNFSPDGQISQPTAMIGKLYLVLATLAASCYLLLSETGLSAIKSLRVGEMSTISKIAYSLLPIMVATYVFCGDSDFLYKEDCFYESLTAIFALASATIFFIMMLRENLFKRKMVLFFLFLFFFFFGMEEISWGQRILGWKTPSKLTEINYQNETNIHNILHPYLDLIHTVSNLVLGALLLFRDRIASLLRSSPRLSELTSLVPSREFSWFGAIFIVLSSHSLIIGGSGELTEEITSVFGLAYATSILIISKKQSDYSL